jgi:mRNA-degrading endonuclease RelE of RelBE toxin-antitoxin system
MTYRIIFADSVRAQLETLTVAQRKTLLEAIQQQLTHEPLVGTRNRKRLRPNPLAPWELRVGRLRAFYDVVESVEAEPTDLQAPGQHERGAVQILAVGEKRGNLLWIAGKRTHL